MLRKNLRIYEYIHIPFWLVKDTCWALELKTLGLCMVVPTLFLAIIISAKTRKNISDFLPNVAIALWITANSIWMCDEFFELGIKEACFIPFFIGLLVIAYWLVFYFPNLWKQLEEVDKKD
jgi:hypothetical protein